MARIALLLLALVAAVACVSAVSTGSPILRLSSTGGVSPAAASSSAAPVVVASSTGPVAPVEQYVFSSDSTYEVCEEFPTTAVCTFLLPLQANSSACVSGLGTSTYSLLLQTGFESEGSVSWTETVFAQPKCAGVMAVPSFTDSAAWPTVQGQWNNFTSTHAFVNGTNGGSLLPGNGQITVKLVINLGYFGPTLTDEESGPDVHPVVAVILCAAVILIALLLGSSMMKSWQSTKFTPARTIAGDAIAAGSYGKF